jgi:hypothetical protein
MKAVEAVNNRLHRLSSFSPSIARLRVSQRCALRPPPTPVKFECTNSHFFSVFFRSSNTFFSQEASATTEIELNELLKRFVVRQAKRRDGSKSPDPQPTRSAQHRS